MEVKEALCPCKKKIMKKQKIKSITTNFKQQIFICYKININR
jgi:hypothetical protein